MRSTSAPHIHRVGLLLGAAVLGAPSRALAQGLDGPGAVPSMASQLAQTVVALGLVCALAWVALRFGLGRWLAARQGRAADLELIERLELGDRRTILLVRAGRRVLIVGASDAGLAPLGQLDPEELGAPGPERDDRPGLP